MRKSSTKWRCPPTGDCAHSTIKHVVYPAQVASPVPSVVCDAPVCKCDAWPESSESEQPYVRVHAFQQVNSHWSDDLPVGEVGAEIGPT